MAISNSFHRRVLHLCKQYLKTCPWESQFCQAYDTPYSPLSKNIKKKKFLLPKMRLRELKEQLAMTLKICKIIKLTNMKDCIKVSTLSFLLKVAQRFCIYTAQISKHSQPWTPIYTRFEGFKWKYGTPAVQPTTVIFCACNKETFLDRISRSEVNTKWIAYPNPNILIKALTR